MRNDRSYSYKNAVYVSHDDPKNNQMICVGTQKDVCASLGIFEGDEMKACLKYNDEGNSALKDYLPAYCFNDVIKVVTAENMLENLVVGTNRGSVTVFGMPPRFLREDPDYRYEEIMAHYGEVTSLQASIDGRYVFSAGSDGIMFMYEVIEYTPPVKHGRAMGSIGATKDSAMIDTGTVNTHSIMSNVKNSLSGAD